MEPEQLAFVFRLNLRLRREKLGLSQVKLAKMSGVGQARISDFERGRNVPTIRTLAKLAKALKCPPTQLLDPAVLKIFAETY